MIPLTPGRLTALWLVLRSLDKLGGCVGSDELVEFAARSGLRSGGLPVGDGYKLGLRGRFLVERATGVVLTKLGQDALEDCGEDEPNQAVRRRFLSVLMLMDPPGWVAFWQGDPTALETVLSASDRALLESAGLFPPSQGDDLERSGWWDALAVLPIPESVLALRKAIGDAGEELSLRFERARLTAGGFPELAERVWWAGRESSAYGFDVGSFVGSDGGARPETPLAIEVKSVAYPVTDNFTLHLTVHEWRTAKRLGAQYRFHLWDRVRVGESEIRRVGGPRIAVSGHLASHLARLPPCGGRCTWESTLVELPLKELQPESFGMGHQQA